MSKFTDAELELAPKVAEILGLPIPTIDSPLSIKIAPPSAEDCLEWLREKTEWLCLHPVEEGWCVEWESSIDSYVVGNTPKEAAYRCVVEMGGKNE